jgi:hypothetical protein
MGNADVNRNSGHNSVRFAIVQTQEQMLDALSIRAICFMEEEGISARQAFDGNDFQATHMLVYAHDEPIGAIRIRWFSDFAKLERTAFRKAYRDPRILKAFAEFVFSHVARKGYRQVITHAKPLYARLWRQMLKFEPVTTKPPVLFAGHEEPYVELVRHLAPAENAITPDADPTVMFRVEGCWDEASRFEAGGHA